MLPFAVAMLSTGARAQDVPPTARDLAELSLEQLANLQITSVSKRPERLADAAASVFIITADEIRQSGATTLPEALRLAPNLMVAQASASAYNILARGVYNTSANKMLVLIDGRSVYSPLFAGVFWDVQDVMLEDVERIEVISGPGGTLWGVNAVNGVINVITRSAKDTQGSLLAGHGGNHDSGGALRFGAALNADTHYRIYARYFDRDHTFTASGRTVDDAWHRGQVGLRGDWARGGDQLAVMANAYRGTMGQPQPGSISVGIPLTLEPIPVSGANLTTRWSHRFEGGSEAVVQAYIDRTERTIMPTFAEKLDIADVQFQHSIQLGTAHALVWGAEYRHSMDHAVNSSIVAFLPARVNQDWTSVFAQGDTALRDDLRLTVGARFERNDYTGLEFLPSVRLGWKMAPDQLLWSAASRAVRAPSRLDRDVFVPGQPPFLLDRGPDARSEVAEVYEIGYRGQLGPNMSASLTAYHADYDDLHTQEITPSRTSLFFGSGLEAATNGVELWGTWQATSAWRLSAGMTAQRERFRLKPGSNDGAAVGTAGRDPAHTWIVRSSTNLSRRVELDVTVRGVAALANPAVPRYSTMDIRIGWQPHRDVELAIGAWNLTDGGHGEFTSEATRTEVRRSVFASVRWHFDTR